MSSLQHIHKYFADRTVTTQDLDRFGITIVPPSEGAEALGLLFPPKGATLCALLPGNEGSRYYHSIWQIGGTGGFAPRPVSFVKLTSKSTTAPNDVVMLPGYDWAFPPQRVLIAESYVKGIVLSRLGYPVIVLNGVAGYSRAGGIVPRLLQLPWEGSDTQVVVCFDSINVVNADSARNVGHAKRTVAGIFHRHYELLTFDLALPPPTDGREDWGVDDYVVANGLEALRTLVDAAQPLEVNELAMAIDEYNQRYAFIADLAKIATTQPPFRVYSKEDFYFWRGKDKVQVPSNRRTPDGAVIMEAKQIPKLWAEDRRRLDLDRLVFRPGEERFVDSNLNVWAGLAVEPDYDGADEAEDYFAALVREAIPDGAEWLLDAMASLVQHPERRTGWYLYFKGEKGTGKGYVTGLIKAIFGGDRAHAPSLTLENYCNKFNIVKASARVLLIDEMPSPMPKDFAGMFEAELKLDADPNARTRPVEGKGRNLSYMDRNCTVVISSNFMPEWPIEWGDRRAACLQFRDEMCILDTMRPWGTKDYAWWERRFKWRDEQNGVAKTLAWLMERDISRFDPEAAPLTTQLKQQIVGFNAGDFRGFLQNLKSNGCEYLEYMGEDLSKFRYATAEQLAVIYHAGEEAHIDKRRLAGYGRALHALGFEAKLCKPVVNGKQIEVRAWKLWGPSEVSGVVVYQDYVRPLGIILTRSSPVKDKY